MQRHETVEQALDAVQEALDQARKFDKFMVAIWASDEESSRVHMLTKTTWQFPMNDLYVALNQLRQAIKEDMEPEIEPLPMAAFARSKNSEEN